ncbi:cytochrome b [Neorickettsia helminthoeca str. Oregon]|uniref:Cytochrome b n=1 Tax=Neorickettsia helminthoeca str. Oregon TaxID=1286528 RepID=X5H4Q5_9RICK|nr:cytochrome b/b6 [Neorickettsia helminthoeca]AHX11536.1 cytochrome b [Neorickettsia helminthoeca str. Oregon]
MRKIDGNPVRRSGIIDWIEYRLPIFSFLREFIVDYRVPININPLWNFGVLAGLSLVIQILTGIFLAMHYDPNAANAFTSVEHITRDVSFGWLIRYSHQVGASMFFVVVYVHIFRGLYYGSYKEPRELLWILGVAIFLVMMATAFLGYVLPWGQMSFWAATVITNFFSAIPLFGESITQWIWGGFAVGSPTLNKFFALHYLFPFIIVAIVILHLAALHRFGSNNPSGIEVKSDSETVPFHPYHTAKDFVTVVLFFIVFSGFLFFAPDYLGHPDNFIEADPLVTPQHIVPEWYFLPFYAILRAIPSKLGGVVALFSAVLILVLVPWLDTSKVKSGRYRPIFKKFFLAFLCNFVFLVWLGGREAIEPYITMSRLATLYYFGYFMIVLPVLGKFEKTLPLPKSIQDSLKSDS